MPAIEIVAPLGRRLGHSAVRELEPALERWARASGCKKIIAFGIKPGWAPVGRALGYRHLWTVMTKDVE